MDLDKQRLIFKATIRFKDFLPIFWLSYDKPKQVSHFDRWADMLQDSKNTAILSARRHLKSTVIYAYLMWQLFRSVEENREILFISLKEDLARYHIRNLKKLISMNPYFKDYKDLSSAESEIRGTWSKSEMTQLQFIHRIEPSGMESLKRGRRADIIICDDVLADPTIQLEPVKIEKANRIFFEEIMSIPREGGEVKVVGTAQHSSDLFFKLKDNKNFTWSFNPAILNEKNKEVLWPEVFSYERLLELRDIELGEKVFNKEYMCSPVWSEDAFFTRQQLMPLVDANLKNRLDANKNNRKRFIAGLDIGKHLHPSHLAVFEQTEHGTFTQIYSHFFDGCDYNKQVEFINALAEKLMIDVIRFDNTRGEFEGFMETGICPNNLWVPINFTAKEKFSMAANFEKMVVQGKVKFINDERQLRSILAVNNNLDAMETEEGHGDAFWSIALALSGRVREAYIA